MNIHSPVPSLLPHICSSCGLRDSDPTYHRTPVATVSPLREATFTTRSGVEAVYAPEPAAVARRTDPSTSWEAARSVMGIRESQQQVLDQFRFSGPMTDEEAYREHRRYNTSTHIQSVSGFRTRRSELVARGLLRDTGERRRGSTGRRMIVWAAT